MEKKGNTQKEEHKAQESSKVSKETIKQNTDKQNEQQAGKPTKAQQVERNDDKDQE